MDNNKFFFADQMGTKKELFSYCRENDTVPSKIGTMGAKPKFLSEDIFFTISQTAKEYGLQIDKEDEELINTLSIELNKILSKPLYIVDYIPMVIDTKGLDYEYKRTQEKSN